MSTRLWPLLTCWAVSLLILRWLVIVPSSLPLHEESVANDPTPVSHHASSLVPSSLLSSVAPDDVRIVVTELLRDVEALSKRSYYAQEVEAHTAELLSSFQHVLGSDDTTDQPEKIADSAAKVDNHDAQQVHPSDGFLKQPRRSRIPMMLPSEELFCDQFLNTFPTPFGGDIPVETVELWCRRGLVAEAEGDHLPPGVDDGHVVQFTMLQMYRRLYFAAQFQDRLVRYRELFQPMIDAIEKRHDRMLYNYI